MRFIKGFFEFVFSKKFVRHIGLIILLYLLVIAFVINYLDNFTNHGQKVEVPNLVGKNISTIKSTLENLNLSYEVVEVKYNPKKVKGTILGQDPQATSISNVFVKEDRVIRLKISKSSDLVEMPDLISKSERFAIQMLKNRGLKYEIEYKMSSESNGAVLDQQYNNRSIRGSGKLPVGAVVTLIVGRNDGGDPVQIPNLYGLTLLEAESILSNNSGINFFSVCPECLTKSDSLKARIESQVPAFSEETLSPFGTTVTVYANPNFVEIVEDTIQLIE